MSGVLAEINKPKVKAKPDDVDKTVTGFVGGFRKHTVRYGASATALKGLGLWITARGPVAMTFIDLQVLLAKAEDLETYDGLPDALETFDKKIAQAKQQHVWPFALMAEGDTAWVPHGTVPLMTTSSDLTFVSVLPWVKKDLYVAVHVDVKEVIQTSLLKYAKSMQAKDVWKNLGTYLKGFFSEDE